MQVLTTIEKYKPELLGYRGIPKAPITTNIIEGLNSHLEARLFKGRAGNKSIGRKSRSKRDERDRYGVSDGKHRIFSETPRIFIVFKP